ncbi:unnamed protein product, partial [Mesorhabditis belari]|uniref:Ornithine decarboxylase n=1 Tax=Mesorhabditis belari TaxID=2138241 RepID=A0AAF3J309_9BILA
MIERVCLRRRLASSTYHPSSPLEGNDLSQETLADQKIAVFGGNSPSLDDVCRHVASKENEKGSLPFFVMSIPRLQQAIKQWSERMIRVKPFYSLRCNADPVLCRLLADHPNEMFNFEAQDAHLLEKALDLVPPDRILYSNPCLTRKALKHADEVQVGTIIIESERDLLNAISYAPNAKLLIRVCMMSYLNCFSNDVETRFGCSFQEARDILLIASELRGKVIGISFNMDANANPSLYYKALRSVKELMDEGERVGLTMRTICLGGGFDGEKRNDFNELSDIINDSMDSLFPSSIDFICTPGRFFASPAFNLCTTVIAKRSTEAQVLTNDDFDSGFGFIYQINEGIYGSFGCRLDNCNPKCRPLDSLPHHFEQFPAKILGPNVDGTDVAQPLTFLPQLSIGEWLVWDQMGAYSMPYDGETPQLPVYYYDSKKAWDDRHSPKNPLKRIDSDSGLGSDAGSEPPSDSEDWGDDEDQENLSPYFHRFFHQIQRQF